MKLASLLEKCFDIKLELGPMIGKFKNADLVTEMCTALQDVVKKDGEASLKFLLEQYVIAPEEIFTYEDRDVLSYKIAYNLDNIKAGKYVGTWKAFIPNEEVAFQIVKAAPCRVDNKIFVSLTLRAESSAAVGMLFDLTLTLGQCTRFAYCLGYGRTRIYDGDPRNLVFLRMFSKVKGGTKLVLIGEPRLNTLQKTKNTLIAKRRSGECPLGLSIPCCSCKRTFGQFNTNNSMCEGSVRKK